MPRLLDSRVSARNWTGVNSVPAQVITQYSVAGDGACVLTAPDGTIYKEYYGTGWQKGLTTLSEVWSGGVRQKWTTTAWTQDNTAVGYEAQSTRDGNQYLRRERQSPPHRDRLRTLMRSGACLTW